MTSGLIVSLNADEGITLNGSDVSAWADQSGEGNDFAQSTPADQPSFVPAWRNGRAAILGGSADQSLDASIAVSGPVTVFSVVATVANDAAFDTLIDFATGTGRAIVTNQTGLGYIFITSYMGALSLPAATTPMVEVAVFDGSSSSLALHPDGVAPSTATGLNPGIQGSTTSVKLLNITAAQRPYRQPVAAYLVYDRVLSAPEIATTVAFLSSHYDIVTI